MADKKIIGLVVPGNIDLYNRPEIPNPYEGGEPSTVYSTSFQEERPNSPYFGKEVLVPRAVGNRILTEDEARRNYEITGHHMGVFDNPDAATAYAQQVHNDYAAGKYGIAGRPFQMPEPKEVPTVMSRIRKYGLGKLAIE